MSAAGFASRRRRRTVLPPLRKTLCPHGSAGLYRITTERIRTLNSIAGFSARNFLCRRRFGRSQIRRAFCGCEPRLANIEIQGQAYLVHRRIRPPFYISEAKPILLVSESPLRRGIRRYGLRPDTVPPPATIRAGHGILNGRSAAARPRLHDDAGNRTVPLPCNDKIRRPLLRQTTAHPLPHDTPLPYGPQTA